MSVNEIVDVDEFLEESAAVFGEGGNAAFSAFFPCRFFNSHCECGSLRWPITGQPNTAR
jgi:hypothetical protein